MYPSSGFWGPSFRFLYARSGLGIVVPFFVPSFRFWGSREIRQNQPFGNHPSANPGEFGAESL